MKVARYVKILWVFALLAHPCITPGAQQSSSVSEESLQPSVDAGRTPVRPSAENSPSIVNDHPANVDVIRAHPSLGKAFWIAWAANFTMLAFTNEWTMYCVNAKPSCVEGNPVWGKKPTRLELYGVKGSVLGLAFYLARREKLRGHSYWKNTTIGALGAMSFDAAIDAHSAVTGPHPTTALANPSAQQVHGLNDMPFNRDTYIATTFLRTANHSALIANEPADRVQIISAGRR